MLLRVRRFLPILIGAAWAAASWYWLLGAPRTATQFWASLNDPRARLSEFDALGWLGLLLLTMWLADRLFTTIAARIWGVDPYSVPWWWLRTEDGRLFCPQCRGTFFLPPVSLAPDEPVSCERCGRAVASLADFRRHS